MSGAGIVGHIGRKGLRFALTGPGGGLLAGSVRQYGVDLGASVSGTLSVFQRDLALDRLPERLAIAVAGLPRGDAISITQTHWFVSRSGLQAMLGRPPLILNDFEAEAWALSGGDHATFLPAGSAPNVTIDRPGTYCVIGMTSGLGVSVLVRDAGGAVHVLATEAGHAGFAPGSRAMADLCAKIFPDRFPLGAEHIISAKGLLALYNGLATLAKSPHRMTTPEEVTRRIGSDPIARQACELLCEAFWTYVGSLVLTYGAWDGVVVTGKLAMALRQMLTTPRMHAVFAGIGTGKHARVLATVPRALVALDQAELIGAAEALHRRTA